MSRSESPVVHAKVSAMYGKRLKSGDYAELLGKSSPEEVAAALKEHPAYGQVLADVDAAPVHREHLEAILRKKYFFDFLKLFHYLGKEDRAFLMILIERYEIEEILWCIARLHDLSPEQAGFIDYKYEYIDRYSRLDFEKLSVLKSETELIEALAGTPYGRILAALPDKTGRISYPVAEHSLHAYYFKALFARIKKRYGSKKAPQIEKTIGIEVDTLNVLLIYRLRILFGLPEEETREYLFDTAYRLKPDMMASLLRAQTEQAFIEALKATPYRFIADGANGTTFQTAVRAYADRSARRVIHFSRHPVALILAYLVLRDTEHDNLKTIIEGCRYRAPREQIIPHLIGAE